MRQEQGKLYALYASIGHEAPLAVGPDGFPVLRTDALGRAHEALSGLLDAVAAGAGCLDEAERVVAGWRGQAGELLAAACARMAWAHDFAMYQREDRIWAFGQVVEQLAHVRASCDGARLGWALEVLGELRRAPQVGRWPLEAMAQLAARCVSARGLEGELVKGIGAALDGMLWQQAPAARQALEQVLEGVHEAHFELDVAWTQAAQAELDVLEEGGRHSARAAWDALLDHMPRPKTKAPGARWWSQARQVVGGVGADALRQRLCCWLPLVIRHGVGAERNEECLRGLVWAATLVADAAVAALLGELAEVSWRRGEVSRGELRLASVCVAALGMMDAGLATGPLCRLKLRSRGAAHHAVERALEALAEAAGVEVEVLEERGQPTLGLDEQGCMREAMGDWVGEARVVAETLKVEVRWVRASSYGQVRLLFAAPEEEERGQKAAPRAVRERCGAQLAAFEINAHEIERALATQKERLEALLLRPRRWAAAEHEALYLEHPLVGQIARRLLWAVVGADGAERVALRRGGRWETVSGAAVEGVVSVALWHPAMSEEAEVSAWRKRLATLGVAQPVRQAWREVWREGELERGDKVWAAGAGAKVRQLHLAALGKARGWQVEVLPRRGFVGRLARLELGGGMAAELWAQAVGQEVEARAVPAVAALMRVRCVEADGSHVGLDGLGAGVRSEVLRDVAFFAEVAGSRERMGA
jgi:hypothetical protein